MLSEDLRRNHTLNSDSTPQIWSNQETCQGIFNALKNTQATHAPNDYSWEEIWKLWINIFSKYKKNGVENNPYLNGFTAQWPFSMINQQVDYLENSKQERWKNTKIWEQSFYTVNNDMWNMDQQLLVNRIFSPFLAMSPIISLIESNPTNIWERINKIHKNVQGEEYIRNSTVVSVDANEKIVNKKGVKNDFAYQEGVPQQIKDTLRIIYQFIAQDWDRYQLITQDGDKTHKKQHNILDDMIFDFDSIWLALFHRNDLKDITFDGIGKYTDEIAEILFFFQKYLEKIIPEIKKDSGQNMEKILRMLEQNTKMLSMKYIIDEMKIQDLETISAADTIDEKALVMHKPWKIAV